jgi:two-component system response regulator GlrR
MARVLLVDDDAAGLPIRKLILEAAGHRVWTAASAAEARAEFAAQRPEAVIIDLRLPRAEDGLALIREWRAAFPGLPELRIVVLSGWTADLEREDREAVDQVLRKPVRSERLLAAIARRAP